MVGCKTLVRNTNRCDAHKALVRKQVDAARQSAVQRGYGWKWSQARAAYLTEHPLCECSECQAGAKRITPAQVVDHKIPHRGDDTLFWDRSNWQAMSKACHDAKTAREDGGFGNRRRLSQ